MDNINNNIKSIKYGHLFEKSSIGRYYYYCFLVSTLACIQTRQSPTPLYVYRCFVLHKYYKMNHAA